MYAVNIYLGRKQNDEVALAWAAQFCDDGAVLDRNFSLLGTGNNSGEVSGDLGGVMHSLLLCVCLDSQRATCGPPMLEHLFAAQKTARTDI